MNKVILILIAIFMVGCKATPFIVNEKNPQGYIIKDKSPTSGTPLAEVVEISGKPLDLSWWWIVWIMCFIGLILYTIKFIKLFNK